MNMKKLGLLLLMISIVSCKTVQVNQLKQKTTKKAVELGVIGVVTKGLQQDVFQTRTLPVYKQKIRILASITTFTDDTFNAYAQSAIQQNQPIKITYIDSVANKPGYAQLQLLDKVSVLKELNANHNKEINTFLQNSNANVLVTSISAYFNMVDLSTILQAEEVYLVNNKPQKYSLELVKNGKPFGMLDVSKGVAFGYTTASFCWKKEGGTVSIANIIEGRETCARDSYKNVARLNKKVNYFKY